MRAGVALLSVWLMLAGGSAAFVVEARGVVTERVVVVFHDDVADPEPAARELARAHGASLGFVYRHALKGFSAEVPADRVDALARDPRVALVEPDLVFEAFGQTLPTGVDRAEVDYNPQASIDGTDTRVDVDIAIIDTGIDYTHPDLYVTKATDCTSSVLFPHCTGSSGNLIDKNGHGTHVAGSAGALDNDIGVVGVAPGARLWSVKVLDQNGSGFLSGIIAGIDVVTQYADEIDVANMSLGCECSSAAMDDAIANSVAAGVVYAVAAGNSAKDASAFSPANHPDVITVSALADFDGLAGGAGEATCRSDIDDTLADFSNYGPLVEVAAPGVCITSTWLDDTYNTISGTSMATPHVTGAAGILIAFDGRDRNGDGTINKADADSVRQTLIDGALPQGHECGYVNERAGEGSTEPLLFVNAAALGGDGTCDAAGGGGDQPPTVTISAPGDGEAVSGSVEVAADATDDDGVVQVAFTYQTDGGSFPIGTDTDGSNGWSAAWDTTALGDGSYAVVATATDTADQTGSDSVSVTVDNTDSPPTVSVTHPGEGDAVEGVVVVTADATDDDGVTAVEFFVDGSPIGVDSDGSDGWSGSWDTASGPDGSHEIAATATDTSGQTATDSVTATVDNTAPHVDITAPTEGETVSGTVTVTATASDATPVTEGTGIAEVEFFSDGVSIGVDTDGSDGWSIPWDTTSAGNGGHTVEATATDGAGNTGGDSVTVTVDNTANPNAIYVWDIEPTTSKSGPWTNVISTVTVLRDADADGAESSDEPVSGARVTYRLARDAGCDGTYESVFDFRTDKTNSAGTVTFSLKTQGPDGCWQGSVIELTNGSYGWDQSLDRNNPRMWRISGGGIVS